MPHPLSIFSQSDCLIQIVDTNSHNDSVDPDQLASSGYIQVQQVRFENIFRTLLVVSDRTVLTVFSVIYYAQHKLLFQP